MLEQQFETMTAAAMTVRARLLTALKPSLIGASVYVAGGEITVRGVRNVANLVLTAEEALCRAYQLAFANTCFVVRDPMPDLELQHLVLAVWKISQKAD